MYMYLNPRDLTSLSQVTKLKYAVGFVLHKKLTAQRNTQ